MDEKKFAWLFVVLQVWILSVQKVNSLSHNAYQRRRFILKGGAAAGAALSTTLPTQSAYALDLESADATYDFRKTLDQLDAKTISWTNSDETLSWSKSRYRASSLSSNSENYAPPAVSPIFYPTWMEGYWSITYKFNKASFPQGRKILSLRTAGAGLGTCLSLPNIGYNPPPLSARFLFSNTKSDANFNVYEDLSYNTPRRFEAFWPESKVLSVQTNGSPNRDTSSAKLTSKCFVTGDGCSASENPNFLSPASRILMDFNGPTRRAGRLTQSCDTTLVGSSFGMSGEAFVANKSFSQYNASQSLQTFYKEIASFQKKDEAGSIITGRIRVAAFLPKNIKELDGGSDTNNYDEDKAIAIYDYKYSMKKIEDFEASSM